MKRTPVVSTQIRSVGHDPKANVLHVEFQNGSVYSYPNVTADHHAALMGAKSLGEHFHANIKGNARHPHSRIMEGKP